MIGEKILVVFACDVTHTNRTLFQKHFFSDTLSQMMTLNMLKRQFEETEQPVSDHVKLRKFDTRAYLATLVTTEQSDENVAADRAKMQAGLKKMDDWLSTHCAAKSPRVTSVTAYLEKSEWSNLFFVSIVEFLVNVSSGSRFNDWLEKWCNVFSTDWNDYDQDEFPDLNNYWDRCECVLKLIFSRVTLTAPIKGKIDKVLKNYQDDAPSLQAADFVEPYIYIQQVLCEIEVSHGKRLMK